MEICANLPKIFFDDQVSYYKLRKKKFLVDNRIVFDKPRFLGSEVLTAVFFRWKEEFTQRTKLQIISLFLLTSMLVFIFLH